MEGSLNLLIFAAVLALTYFTGGYFERRHLRSLRRRERQSLDLPLLTREEISTDAAIAETRFVSGHCVIAADLFKRALAGLRMMFGGRVAAFESLIDRARREAVLRMKDQAEGAVEVACLRIVTSQLGPGRVEAIAYGTALFPHETGQVQEFPPASGRDGPLRGCLFLLSIMLLMIAVFVGFVFYAAYLNTEKNPPGTRSVISQLYDPRLKAAADVVDNPAR